MPHELILRPEAEDELAEAYSWYAQRVPGLGDQFILSVDAVFHAIGRSPAPYPQIFKTVQRALLHRFPYAVFFVESESRITVLAVFHAKRDPRQWQDRT